MASDARLTGMIVTWNENGYFFVRPDGGRKADEIFAHTSDVRPRGDALSVGDKVSYTVGKGRVGKPAAFNVRRLQPFAATGIPSGEFAGLLGAIK